MDIEQLEALALGDDRDRALAALVPGSEDHDTWRAITLQQRGQLDEVDRLLEAWATRHGHTAARARIERRQLLLRLGGDLDAHARRVIDEVGLDVHHQAEVEAAAARHPSRFDDAPLALERIVDDALTASRTLERLTAAALPGLVGLTHAPARRRALLERLDRTGLPGLVELCAADLEDRSSRGFGSLALHGLLTLDELHALARLRPAVTEQRAWVDAVVARLAPPDDVDLELDLDARAAYLDGLWSFVGGLAASFVGLKVHVLYQRLDLDRRRGVLDRERLLAYLALPRRVSYARSAWLDGLEHSLVANLGDVGTTAVRGAVADDEPLVRELLGRLLVTEEAAAFARFCELDWLERLQAEARLLAGAADAERWTNRLGPAAAAALRDRVELELSPTNPPRHAADARVVLDVAIKNVPTLRVRVFRINPVAYFQRTGGEVEATLDLDGLAAGFEEVRTLDAPALLRRHERLELPACDRPGTYVVELIGGGRASRALVRKGGLRALARPSAAGLAVTVVDDTGAHRPGAALWLGGRELTTHPEHGVIAVPWSTRPGRTTVLLVDGELTQTATLDLVAETPGLTAALLLDRQALVPGQEATCVLRPTLSLAGVATSLALLEEPWVELVSHDRTGVPARRRQPLALTDDADVVLSIPVGEHLARLELALGGRYRSVSEQRTVELRHDVAIDVGTLHAGPGTEALFLTWTTAGYRLSLLGKSGEPRPGRAVTVTLSHWASDRTVDAILATDERGAIELGPLPGVTAVAARTGELGQDFALSATRPGHPTEVVLVGDEAITLPAPVGVERGSAVGLDVSLVERRGAVPVRHLPAHVALGEATVTVSGLAPGRYELAVRGQPRIGLRVLPASALRLDRWATTARAAGELLASPPALASLAVDDAAVTITVIGAGPATRVHLLATPMVPEPAWSSDLAAAIPGPRQQQTAGRRTDYVSGRDIGDEYRYVLDRQQAPRRPGVMLDRPGLLLNPWALRTTSTAVQDARPQGAWAGAPPPAPAPAMRAREMSAYGGAGPGQGPGLAPYDFLAEPPVVLANLRPDDDGRIRVERAALGGAQVVRAVCVDPQATSARTAPLPARALAVRDLRLAAALPAERHLREDRRLVPLAAGATLAVVDRATSRVELVDTVDKLYRALCALSGDATLAAWDFLPRWASLPRAEKLRLYSRHACHELAIFIRWKDPALFDEALRPYLASKLDKTFVDRALLDEDLTPYLAPWRLRRLNAFERALLALRLPAAAGLGRVLADEVDLVPPDPSGDDRLVDALLAGGALSGDSTDLSLAEPMPEEAERSDKEKADERFAGFAVGAGLPGAPAASAPAPLKKAKRGGRADADGFAADRALREEAAPMFRAADRTEELAEHNWWHQRVTDDGAALIPARRLWRDLAAHREGPFLSPHLADAASGLAACVCALAVLDLPFSSAAHTITARGAGAELRAGSHALAAVSELAEVAGPPTGEVLVGQSYFRMDDRWEWDGALQREKYVTGPLVVGVVYQCQVVVTNPTSRVRRLAVLTQIPAGAIATAGGLATRTVRVELAAYATTTLEYAFYFPAAGVVAHYPAQVVDGDVLVAAPAPRTLTVVATPPAGDVRSWPHLSQHGTLDEVVEYLTTANLGRVDLTRAAWRLRDRVAFTRITGALANRHVFDSTLWAYAFVHGDRERAAEWASLADGFLAPAAPTIEGGLCELEPVARGLYQHLEYAPLVNARAHRLGERRVVLNDGLASQWRAFLERVACQAAPRRADWLAAAHYLFTMDRPDDAARALGRAEALAAPDEPQAQALQADYLAAYAAAAAGDLVTARARIAGRLDHPVERWRHRFTAVAAMLDEVEGGPTAVAADRDSRDQRMAELAARQPSLAVRVEGRTIVVDHAQLAVASLRFYRMDVELLFSRQPFLGAQGERFAYIEPGRVDELPLAAGGQTRLPLPPELATTNVVIEVAAGALRQAVTHFAHDLAVAVQAPYGQLQVRRASTGAALPAAYVKCYARMRTGAVQFYKDGYTDLRGRLDYATLSTDDLDRVERFALLVVHDQAGATVLEAEPPPR